MYLLEGSRSLYFGYFSLFTPLDFRCCGVQHVVGGSVRFHHTLTDRILMVETWSCTHLNTHTHTPHYVSFCMQGVYMYKYILLCVCVPVYERGLVLLSCRAFMACCCFSSAASMSPRSSCTGVLLFFPAALVRASYTTHTMILTETYSVNTCHAKYGSICCIE